MLKKSLYIIVYGLILSLLFLSGCDTANTNTTASQEALTTNATQTETIAAMPSATVLADPTTVTTENVIPTRPMPGYTVSTGTTVITPENPIPTRPMATKPQDNGSETLVQITDFDIALFKSVVKSSEKSNVIISPLSVKQALAMTANGAQGNTLSQIETLLGNNVQTLNEEFSRYNNSLHSGAECKLNIANSLWLNVMQRISFELAFVNAVKQYYNSHVVITPFNHDTLKDINDWVKQSTDGIVEQMLDSINPDSAAYLINTVTFNAQWEKPYLKRDIYKQDFTNVNGTKKIVDMMTFDESVYLESESATGFIKPYKDNKFSFVAILPKDGNDVYGLVDKLDQQEVNSILSSAQHAEVQVTIPKFRYSYQKEMSEILKANGVTDAFDPVKADFSNMAVSADGSLYISSVLQKTYITMDELGTVAGSATVVIANEGGIGQKTIKSVTLDRPFVYMILDNTTNCPVFMGVLAEL